MRNSKYFVLAGVLLLADQLIKALVVAYQPASQFLVFVKNTGATFGLFPGSNAILAVVSVFAIGLIKYFLYRTSSRADAFGLSLVLAGVTGNFFDRVLRGFVVDYVRVGSFPVFNLADACIVSGVLLLVLLEVPAVRKRLQS